MRESSFGGIAALDALSSRPSPLDRRLFDLHFRIIIIHQLAVISQESGGSYKPRVLVSVQQLIALLADPCHSRSASATILLDRLIWTVPCSFPPAVPSLPSVPKGAE